MTDTLSSDAHLSPPSGAGTTATSTGQQQQASPAVLARVPGLQRLPNLSLDEEAHARECYDAVVGEQKECVSTTIELRVLLGRLGLYPSEAEMALVVRAARERVNFTALTRYLRFCKREFEVAAAATATPTTHQANSGGGGMVKANASAARLPFGGAPKGSGVPVVAGGDSDTLGAFVALGGNEDGSGVVDTARLSEVVRDFQLTVDIEAMIASVDVGRSGTVDYAEFCRMWTIPAEELRRLSLSSLAGSFCGPAGGLESGAAGGGAGDPRLGAPASTHRGTYQSGAMSMLASNRPTLSPGRSSLLGRLHTMRRQSSVPGLTEGPSAQLYNASPGGKQQQGGGGARGAGKAAAAAAPQPLTEGERYQLLHMYLLPEQHEANTRRARLQLPGRGVPGAGAGAGREDGGGPGAGGAAGSTGAGGVGNGSLPPLSGGAGRGGGYGRRSVWASQGPRRTVVGARAAKTTPAAGGDSSGGDVFSLQRPGNGVYQPPSPVILFQRSSRRTNSRRPGGKGLEGTGKGKGGKTTGGSAGAFASAAAGSTSSAAVGAAPYAAASQSPHPQGRVSSAKKAETY